MTNCTLSPMMWQDMVLTFSYHLFINNKGFGVCLQVARRKREQLVQDGDLAFMGMKALSSSPSRVPHELLQALGKERR